MKNKFIKLMSLSLLALVASCSVSVDDFKTSYKEKEESAEPTSYTSAVVSGEINMSSGSTNMSSKADKIAFNVSWVYGSPIFSPQDSSNKEAIIFSSTLTGIGAYIVLDDDVVENLDTSNTAYSTSGGYSISFVNHIKTEDSDGNKVEGKQTANYKWDSNSLLLTHYDDNVEANGSSIIKLNFDLSWSK